MLICSATLYIVHLTRDARAIAFSWLRRESSPSIRGEVYMPRLNLLHSALWWNSWNGLTSLFGKLLFKHYLYIRYEDFCYNPSESLIKILKFAKVNSVNLPFKSKYEAEIQEHHILRGNPNRFQRGLVNISLDEDWRRQMKLIDKLIVTTVSLPLLYAYKYTL